MSQMLSKPYKKRDGTWWQMKYEIDDATGKRRTLGAMQVPEPVEQKGKEVKPDGPKKAPAPKAQQNDRPVPQAKAQPSPAASPSVGGWLIGAGVGLGIAGLFTLAIILVRKSPTSAPAPRQQPLALVEAA